MKEKLFKLITAVFLLVFFVAPVCLYTVARLGFPPVVGNLLAARSMASYAAQAHPDWTPEGGWANYNLVVDGYGLSFTDGMRSHSLGYANGVVQDSGREEALEAEFDIAKALRINGLHNSGEYHVYWSARWPAKTPDQPQITVVVDFYDSADTPVPDEAAMREKWRTRPCGPMRPCPRPALSTAFPSGTATREWQSSTMEMSGTSSR